MATNVERTIAQALLNVEAVFLKPNNPFTWASGIKSPIYCDNRITLSYPETRTLIKNSFIELIKKNYPSVEVIAGVATAGIPQASIIADTMQLPLVYVRSSAKDHGRTNMIEGKLDANAKVVLIEDLISTGGSSLKAAESLQEAGAELLGLAAIFSYNLKQAKIAFDKAKISLATLSNYDALLELAQESGKYSEEELILLQTWREALI
jgi:orotate phosphoribosyltransferase